MLERCIFLSSLGEEHYRSSPADKPRSRRDRSDSDKDNIPVSFERRQHANAATPEWGLRWRLAAECHLDAVREVIDDLIWIFLYKLAIMISRINIVHCWSSIIYYKRVWYYVGIFTIKHIHKSLVLWLSAIPCPACSMLAHSKATIAPGLSFTSSLVKVQSAQGKMINICIYTPVYDYGPKQSS